MEAARNPKTAARRAGLGCCLYVLKPAKAAEQVAFRKDLNTFDRKLEVDAVESIGNLTPPGCAPW